MKIILYFLSFKFIYSSSIIISYLLFSITIDSIDSLTTLGFFLIIFLANESQVDIAKAMIRKLMVPFTPGQIENPTLQRFYSLLEALALNRETQSEVVDHTCRLLKVFVVLHCSTLTAVKDYTSLTLLTTQWSINCKYCNLPSHLHTMSAQQPHVPLLSSIDRDCYSQHRPVRTLYSTSPSTRLPQPALSLPAPQ